MLGAPAVHAVIMTIDRAGIPLLSSAHRLYQGHLGWSVALVRRWIKIRAPFDDNKIRIWFMAWESAEDGLPSCRPCHDSLPHLHQPPATTVHP
jgi:hypothetical protein